MAAGNVLEFGIVGLGRMGGGLTLQALEKGMRVAGYEPKGAAPELLVAGMTACLAHSEFRALLQRPRIVFLYVPAGRVVDQVLDELAGELEPGDVLVDGGNSYWGDSLRRYQRLLAREI